MSKLCHLDVLAELHELCQDIIQGIRNELRYYRASVYKEESAKHINRRIEQLRFIVDVIDDEMVREPFQDFEAEAKAGIAYYVPGECPFFGRVTRLLSNLEEQLSVLEDHVAQSRASLQNDSNLTRAVKKHRRQLLGMCRQGSRPWCFFQAV
jgi:hypothetical protein